MSKGREHSADYLRALFHGDGFPQYGTEFWVSLHTKAPSSQNDGEVGYEGYARAPIGRSSSDWTVEGILATNISEVLFPAKTSESKIEVSHVGLGTESAGSGKLLRILTLRDAASLWIGRRAIVLPGQLKFSEI
jgi:hypothetical protein